MALVPTERLNQNCLEEYFGKHRALTCTSVQVLKCTVILCHSDQGIQNKWYIDFEFIFYDIKLFISTFLKTVLFLKKTTWLTCNSYKLIGFYVRDVREMIHEKRFMYLIHNFIITFAGSSSFSCSLVNVFTLIINMSTPIFVEYSNSIFLAIYHNFTIMRTVPLVNHLRVKTNMRFNVSQYPP